MNRHVIRLGAAWEPPTAAGGGGSAWVRRFGRPSGLQAGDRVLLVWERAAVMHDVPAGTLNGTPLPGNAAGASRWEHDVTALLRDRNELRLEVPRPEPVCETAAPHGRADLPAAWGSLALVIVTG
ncbi:MAG: hypothetical protein EBT70_09620 [Betaproteobacteria bacterium]|nr:hypothetical protein [Betaproteobacteria bacterium]